MKLFTYGSLMDHEIRYKVLGKMVDFEYADLKDFDLKQHSRCAFLTIYSKMGSVVNGMILDIDYMDLYRLDKYENNLYRNVSINVNGIECLVYIE